MALTAAGWLARDMRGLAEFDGHAMVNALDERRVEHELDWPALAHELWDQSAELNAELGGNALCSGALVRTVRRGTMSCQYALIILRWLGRAPEDFLIGPVAAVGDTRLPCVGPDQRLRWDLAQLHAELNENRQARKITWTQLANELRCTPNRITNLKTARLADMALTMRVTQSLKRPAAAFVHPSSW